MLKCSIELGAYQNFGALFIGQFCHNPLLIIANLLHFIEGQEWYQLCQRKKLKHHLLGYSYQNLACLPFANIVPLALIVGLRFVSYLSRHVRLIG